jgi:hypothetical protein
VVPNASPAALAADDGRQSQEQQPTNSSRNTRMLSWGGSPIVFAGFQFFIVIQ